MAYVRVEISTVFHKLQDVRQLSDLISSLAAHLINELVVNDRIIIGNTVKSQLYVSQL